MQVDTTAMLQGVYDAGSDGKIGSPFYERIITAIHEITYSGPVGRPVCDYDRLLKTLAQVKPNHSNEVARLWKYLGKSLASGVTVAN